MRIGVFLLFLLSSCDSGLVDDSKQSDTKLASGNSELDGDTLVSEVLPSPPQASETNTPGSQTKDTEDTEDIEDTEAPCSNEPLISLWKVEAGDEITLPLPEGPHSYRYNFNVDWGDGTTAEVTSHDDPDASHTYDVASEQATGEGVHVHEGKYRVTITGRLEAWSFGDNNSCPNNLVAIEDLGNTCLKSLANAFRGCKKLTQVKGGDTSEVIDLSYAFYRTGENNGSLKLHINSWNTSKVTRMVKVFELAKGITFECDDGSDCDNANLKDWQTNEVRDMSAMFKDLKTANPDVSNWQTESLTDVEMMFYRAKSVNPNVSDWDFSNVRRFRDFIKNSAISDENYCNLIVALGEDIPSGISNSVGHNVISMVEKNCANRANFCEARQDLINDGWTIADATSCP